VEVRFDSLLELDYIFCFRLGNWTESIVLIYDLPNNLGSKIVVIRDEELNENDMDSLQQIV
jgi:hypothetical protein